MRVLLSTIGSRGEVQPLVALASQLRALGQEVRLCVPPDFRAWIEGLGFPVVPIGPELRPTASDSPRATPVRATPEQRRQLLEGTVATQFATIPAAAEGCDVIVAGGALQIAARSIAEQLGIAYVYASYCPITLPSPRHAPLPIWGPAAVDAGDAAGSDEATVNRTLWADDAQHWNDNVGAALNSHRAAIGLSPVADVRGHIFTDQPWLAADPTLGPWPEPADPGGGVVQTGAWIVPERRPLPAELEAFLEAGEPPVYFGFGSARADRGLGQELIKTARELGRRAVVSRGWADLSPLDAEPGWLSIGEADHQALFPRVAAVVHHGGAGTTTAAGLAAAPQVILPQLYDQHYWAQRVGRLGIGVVHPAAAPTADSLATALNRVLQPDVADRAEAVAAVVRTDGARTAARTLAQVERKHNVSRM
jgi:vancomycin aglycone glucosyltransferase